jgi:phosphohistidine phosphatase SixA/8-oxo-dGTP pyrophosphatase MutT (NUDIX family)
VATNRRSVLTPVRAAGGLLWRSGRRGEREVALIYRDRYQDWSLPKGKLHSGEPALLGAVREVIEETGSIVAAGRRLGQAEYVALDSPKIVDYWEMHELGGSFTPSDEVTDLVWLPIPTAQEMASYEHDRGLLSSFARVPATDSVVVLVRHAKAGRRSEWSGADEDRPLEAEGRMQAAQLAEILRVFAPEQVLTASPVRCSQTVQPLADLLAQAVLVAPEFDDERFADDPAAAMRALRKLAESSRASVVCSQGLTIPGLIDGLDLGVESLETRKGAIWVITFAAGQPASADYYRAPTRAS